GLPDLYDKSSERVIEFLQIKREMRSETKIVLSMINFSLNADSIAAVAEKWRQYPEIDEVLSKPFTTWDGSVAKVNDLRPREFTKLDKVTCKFPFTKMTVAWDGDVTPCCFDFDKKLVLGNVTKQSLASIWNGAPMRALRKEFLSNNVTNPLCRKCPSL